MVVAATALQANTIHSLENMPAARLPVPVVTTSLWVAVQVDTPPLVFATPLLEEAPVIATPLAATINLSEHMQVDATPLVLAISLLAWVLDVW
jgi:hypothetical protein